MEGGDCGSSSGSGRAYQMGMERTLVLSVCFVRSLHRSSDPKTALALSCQASFPTHSTGSAYGQGKADEKNQWSCLIQPRDEEVHRLMFSHRLSWMAATGFELCEPRCRYRCSVGLRHPCSRLVGLTSELGHTCTLLVVGRRSRSRALCSSLPCLLCRCRR